MGQQDDMRQGIRCDTVSCRGTVEASGNRTLAGMTLYFCPAHAAAWDGGLPFDAAWFEAYGTVRYYAPAVRG